MSLWQHHQGSDQSSWEGLGDTVKPRAQRHREEGRSGLVGGAKRAGLGPARPDVNRAPGPPQGPDFILNKICKLINGN